MGKYYDNSTYLEKPGMAVRLSVARPNIIKRRSAKCRSGASNRLSQRAHVLDPNARPRAERKGALCNERSGCAWAHRVRRDAPHGLE